MSKTTSKPKIEVERHTKLAFLGEHHPYKVLYGGRGGLKSWGIAQQLVVDAMVKPIRTLCCRETMQSIADSVHKLLADTIVRLGVQAHFEVQKTTIRGINGSEFAFAGLRHNVTGIKSYEAFDRAWVEEAQMVSRSSWNILIPTIRKEDSEIWVSFNPVLENDDTYERFVKHPPPGAVVVRTNWRDNIWLSDKFMADLKHLRDTNPEEFEHVYEGCCIQSVEGAIFAEQLRQAEKDGRITRVPYDPLKPVETFWDLGFGDATAIWFVQAFPYEYRIIDYEEGDHFVLKHYQKQLQSRPYVYGTHYLPHDAQAHDLRTGRSVEELMRSAGFRVQIVPRLSLTDSINAARTIFSECYFDGDKCADGLQALRHYRWGPLNLQGERKREPVHDWASHGGSAWRYVGVGIKKPPASKEVKRGQFYNPPVYSGAWS